ncbi:MAG: hypothetical protein ACOYJF_05425 [Prevotella sp.]|jgi:hypothetical protein
MKKIISSLFALAMAAMTFTSCEDVPAPYDIPGSDDSDSTTTTVEPSGEGTLDSPYNIARAIELIKNGTMSESNVYVKGIIIGSPSIDTDYGNATYYLADLADATQTDSTALEVYRGYYYNGDKFTSTDQIATGDTIVVLGQLVNYNGTYEITSRSQIVSINGVTSNSSDDETGEAEGDGTESNPYNVVAAINYVSSLDADVATTTPIYVKGKISSIKEVSTSYGNATYYISDDGTTDTQFYVYRSKYLNNADFTSESQIAVGDSVVIVGNVVNYKGSTPEFSANDSYLYYLQSSSESSGDESGDSETTSGLSISGTTVTLTNSSVTAGSTTVTCDFSTLGYENAESVTTVTLSDGSTVTFDANGETNGPKYYTATNGVRVYKNNTITINGKSTIAKVVFECDSYNGTDYVGNTTATVTFSGTTALYTNVYTGTSGGGVQLRVKTMTIYYAE